MQIKKEMAINKQLKKQRGELRRIGRSQDMRKKEIEKIEKMASTSAMENSIFIQPLALPVADQPQAASQHEPSQNTIAIPLIHSIQNNNAEMDYSVPTMIREDAIDAIQL